MDKSAIDFKKQIKFSYTDQIIKNEFLNKKPDSSSQKSTPTPVPIKPDSKENTNNFNKDLRIGVNKESSRKCSVDKSNKSNNNSSLIFNGVYFYHNIGHKQTNSQTNKSK
jgi:hypothetical protein